jgi:ammonium transporter Rh
MLIAFGALIGRILPSQILFMSVFGCFFYSLSETLVYDKLQVVDVGGSITIHTFGAYFGLALSFVLGKTHSL